MVSIRLNSSAVHVFRKNKALPSFPKKDHNLARTRPILSGSPFSAKESIEQELDELGVRRASGTVTQSTHIIIKVVL